MTKMMLVATSRFATAHPAIGTRLSSSLRSHPPLLTTTLDGQSTPRTNGASGRHNPRKAESPRVPVRLPPGIVSASPLIDPSSQLSLPETDSDRIRWLNRFTPRWRETRQERQTRFAERALAMRHRQAHTERLLNSFQRLDALTGQVLPSDLLISMSYAHWDPEPNQVPQPASAKKTKESVRVPGTYVVPNRILHPHWVAKNEASSTWILCHRDVLRHPQKLRAFRRIAREPKFSPHLIDQVSSQLVRRVAQECVVLDHCLFSESRPRKLSSTSPLSLRSSSADRPLPIQAEALLDHVRNLLTSSGATRSDTEETTDYLRDASRLGGIIVMSSSLFSQVLELKRTPGLVGKIIETGCDLENERPLMCSIASSDGPIPVWDLEGLLNLMARSPPSRKSTVLVTASINQATSDSDLDLSVILTNQILKALMGPTRHQLSDPDQKMMGFLIPLAGVTYPLLLSLRRSTWWIGQGFEVEHFARLDLMKNEAQKRAEMKQMKLKRWLAEKQTVEGKLMNNGELWVPRASRQRSELTSWKRV